jgi:post-segregation antitoxin (ccd killing protein)
MPQKVKKTSINIDAALWKEWLLFVVEKYGTSRKVSVALADNYSSSLAQTTRVKRRRKTPRKTVGITLPPKLIEEARKHKLNISRICEQALQSVLEYMEAQKIDAQPKQAQNKKESIGNVVSDKVPRAGFEPATTRSSAGRSPRLSYLGQIFHD